LIGTPFTYKYPPVIIEKQLLGCFNFGAAFLLLAWSCGRTQHRENRRVWARVVWL